MLILTRRVGETLMIGDDIAVTVLGLNLIGDGLRDVLDPRLNWRG